jgi:hypothetical protein
LWAQPLDVILSEREKVLKVLSNATKELDFFSQNRIIYALQPNIIRNNNYEALYFPWFDFAQTSRNHENKEDDFFKFKNIAIMAELINRLKIDNFTSEELMYLSGNYELEMQVFQNKEETQRLQNELKAEREKREVELKAEREKREVEVTAEREKRHADLLKGIKKLLNRGETVAGIADFFELSVEEITVFVKDIEAKDRDNALTQTNE